VKLCRKCDSRIENIDWRCPSCGDMPGMIDGFIAFAPEEAQSNPGFKAEYFGTLAKLEEGNFWFRARNRLITWALRRRFPAAENFFEIGCGTGFVLSAIAETCPGLRLFGSEIYSTGLEVAAQRVPKSTFFQMDARNIPFEEEFDVIGAFDVLEHIHEDEKVLSRMYRAVRAGGGVILTVPQHPFLWSRQDEYACHVRRYTSSEVRSKLELAGFAVTQISSFVSLLLPVLAVARLRNRRVADEFDPLDELRMGRAANAILDRVMDLERVLIQLGVSFPAGGSLLVVGTKPGPTR
jgi:SAM-dependent methyltransferase